MVQQVCQMCYKPPVAKSVTEEKKYSLNGHPEVNILVLLGIVANFKWKIEILALTTLGNNCKHVK